ncbi:Rv3235 family protein [Kineosporia sp. NBRC 101731]|uniref:Rv3235 family protein n=1 Tax=Kineosporia sp. NBRC 101731 TaxID=3032199 RepID=UPI002556E40E|nr:Rv3235 family protein [Kineosporia sp. NBRC 101731]
MPSPELGTTSSGAGSSDTDPSQIRPPEAGISAVRPPASETVATARTPAAGPTAAELPAARSDSAPVALPGSSGLLPEPRPWAAAFIQAAMEVASGLRPPTQLIRWTTPEVHGTLVRRGTLTARALRNGNGMGTKPRLRALRVCVPKTGVCEVSAVIAEPERVRAVAFRMEGLHGRWRVTEFEMQGRYEN